MSSSFRRRLRRSLAAAAVTASMVMTALAAHAAAAPAAASRAGYNLAFVDADVRHVVDAVLGDMLHLNYSFDPKVSGSITLRTTQPLDRDGIIGLLEDALAPIGAVVVANGSTYRVLPRDAARATLSMSDDGGSTSGFSSAPVRLRYADPREVANLIGQFVGKDVVVGIDPSTNTILLAGSGEERAAARSVIRRFDVDTLAGATFQMVHLDNVDAEALVGELEHIFQPPFDIIGKRVRLVPLPRLHSIMVVAADQSDIARIEPWIHKLDAGGATARRKLYSYAVQNGRARDLAASLQLVLGRADVAVLQQQTAQSSAQSSASSLDTLGGGFSSGSLRGASGSSGSSIAAPGLEPSQVIGAQTPLPGGDSSSLASAPIAQASQGDVGPRIVPVEATNTLLIYANGEEYGFIQEILGQLDKPVPQILIEATLAEVTLTRDLQYGVNWSEMTGNSTIALSNTGSSPPNINFPGFSYSYIGKSVQAVLNTLQSKTNVRVLSAPKLMVLNNQTATLQVGDEVPIVTQQSQSTVGSNAPIVNSVELRDTGVILKVTPRVNESGEVTLDIAQEVSDVVPTTTSGINSPTIQQRRLTSTVRTRSGEMIALGGLIRETATRSRQGFPGLSQIPIVGGLFGQHTTTGQRTELIILITPVVTRTSEEARATLNDLLGRMDRVQPVIRFEHDKDGHATHR